MRLLLIDRPLRHGQRATAPDADPVALSSLRSYVLVPESAQVRVRRWGLYAW